VSAFFKGSEYVISPQKKYRRSSPIVYQNTATQQDDSKSRLPKNPPEKDSSSKPFYPRVK
jgi:hypothetical protein